MHTRHNVVQHVHNCFRSRNIRLNDKFDKFFNADEQETGTTQKNIHNEQNELKIF